ncbi:MAG TPA: chemotaxis protein CheA [Phycisphaerae bacterium]|nr:chemotaxis protein CheA [Phycisphaerae bacterium]
MTQDVEKLVEKCAAAAVAAQPGELTTLAQLHTDLQAICDQWRERPEAVQRAGHAAELVEKVVIGEVPDAEAALQLVSEQISELQALLDGKAVGTGEKKSDGGGASPKEGAQGEAEIPAERVIVEEDAPLALEFVGEANGHLDNAEASLLKLEEDPNDLAEVNAVFRAFHTIKGVAGFLELKQIGALAHITETLLDLARKGKVQLHGGRLDVVLEARDLMKQLVAAVETAAKTKGAPGKQEGLERLLTRLEAAAKGQEVEEKRATPETTAAAETPAAASAAPASGAAAQTDATVKVATARLDALINTVGELVIAQAMVAQDLGTLASDQRLARNISQLSKITRSLQDLSMSMRMVPIAGVFQKMARLARDVSRKAGKEVEFVQIGSETELDRNVVEAVSDPLVHMVRNAIDHGMEFPEDRVKLGKAREGKLTLKACHQAGNVVIEISDDGRGLPTDKILKKAIAAGVVKEGQELSEQEVFQLIFHPGLSTAEKVTDISGRGVGMDVVKKNVEALRGRIEISSTAGQGSLFTVRLPLTLAVIDGLIVKVGRERYIIPITSIEQSIRPGREQLSTVQGKGEMCVVREKILPIVRLHELFAVEPRFTDPAAALVVIVHEGTQRRCLLVDELVGQQQVVIKSVGSEMGSLPGIAGCAILGDGNVSLILDVAGIIHSALR